MRRLVSGNADVLLNGRLSTARWFCGVRITVVKAALATIGKPRQAIGTGKRFHVF